MSGMAAAPSCVPPPKGDVPRCLRWTKNAAIRVLGAGGIMAAQIIISDPGVQRQQPCQNRTIIAPAILATQSEALLVDLDVRLLRGLAVIAPNGRSIFDLIQGETIS